jgi:hypothetical protein
MPSEHAGDVHVRMAGQAAQLAQAMDLLERQLSLCGQHRIQAGRIMPL